MADSGVGNVHLDVVVTDNSGKPVAGLAAGDFTLLDNSQPTRILSFRAHSAAASTPTDPVEVAIVFDVVNTGFDTVSYTRQQVENYLRQNGGHLAQPVALYFLTNGGVKAQRQPSTDGNALAQDLANATGMLRTINRSAGAWGATERVQFSVQMMGTIALSLASKPGRKLLIWAGPGWPLLDGPNLYLTDKGQKALFQEIVAMNTTLREGSNRRLQH